MTKTNNLRFLLALGNKKVVVVEEQDKMNVYSDNRPSGSKNRLSVERLAEAVSNR